jgi:lipopolysaccharide transport system ATP-binding protein
MEIVAVRLLGPAGFPLTELDSGAPLRVEIEYLAPEPVEAPIFGITISREDGFICYDTSTAATGVHLPAVHGLGQIIFHIERLDLIGEQYYVDVGVYEREWAYAYDYHWHVYPLIIRPTGSEKGILRPPHRWELPDVSVRHASLPTEDRERTGANISR